MTNDKPQPGDTVIAGPIECEYRRTMSSGSIAVAEPRKNPGGPVGRVFYLPANTPLKIVEPPLAHGSVIRDRTRLHELPPQSVVRDGKNQVAEKMHFGRWRITGRLGRHNDAEIATPIEVLFVAPTPTWPEPQSNAPHPANATVALFKVGDRVHVIHNQIGDFFGRVLDVRRDTVVSNLIWLDVKSERDGCTYAVGESTAKLATDQSGAFAQSTEDEEAW